jgi:hypothetical protein
MFFVSPGPDGPVRGFFYNPKSQHAEQYQQLVVPPLENVIALSKICNKFAPFSEKKNQIEENDAGTVAVEVAHRFYGLLV